MNLVAEGVSVSQACAWLELSRSSYYYHSVQRDDSQLEVAIEKVLGEFPTYGTRRVTQQMRRAPQKLVANRKRVQRVMRQKECLQPVKRQKTCTTNSLHPYPRYPNLVMGLVIDHPDQVWAGDITYIRLKNRFIYLASILDVYTRSARGWCLSLWLNQELALCALRQALAKGCPEIHHSDQGIQYAAQAYIDLLKSHHIQISMAAVGKAEENGFAERFMRTLKEEEVNLSEYEDFADAQNQIGYFIESVYNTKRLHSALGYITPVEFEAAFQLAITQHVVEAPLSEA